MVVSIDAVRDELPVDEGAFAHLSASGFDSLLDRLIERETQRVESVVDTQFGVASTTEETSRPAGVDEAFLPLSTRPVQAVTSITVDGDAVSLSDVYAESTHLELRADADRSGWPTRRRAVTVTYDAGIPEADVPAPIEGAVIGLVRQAVVDIEAAGVTQESITGDNVSYELPDQVVARHLARASAYEPPSFYGGVQVG